MLNRIAVLSDIHGNLPALEAVVADMQKRQVQSVFNLGDHLSGPLWPAETADYLMRQDWIQIAGNHDRNLVQQNPQEHNLSDHYAYCSLQKRELDWLKSLPASQQIQDEFSLFHGAPQADTTYLLESIEHGRTRLAAPAEIEERLGKNGLPVLLCGHSHMPRVVQLPGKRLVVNPGSVGLPAYEDDAHSEPHIIECGSPHARYAVLQRQQQGWGVDLISVAYDWEMAAKQAAKNKRAEWECALRYGFMIDAA